MHPESPIRRIHLTGVCGTGMAALAAMLQDSGYLVSGSDESVYPPMSDFLAARGIRVAPGFDAANLQPEPDLVVIGNALSRGNPEIEYVLNFRLRYTSFPRALQDFFLRDRVSVVVAGTHGKTTTAAMIAWGLRVAGMNPDFLVGGIAHNFDSGYGLQGGRYFVVEGDEYDSAFFDKGPKFLHYLPYLAVLGNVEFDHADIYPHLEAVKLQFARFVNLLPQRGFLALGAESRPAAEAAAQAHCRVETFGLDAAFDWSAGRIAPEGDRLAFDAIYKRKLFRRLRLALPGAFNIRNALAAVAILNRIGVPEDDIRGALESFRGVRRRLEFVAEVSGVRVYQDFAHHPTAVRETLKAIRETYRPPRLWAIYEPRSATSRRKVFQQEIAEALALADCVVLPPLYRPEKIEAQERLDLVRVVANLEQAGRVAWNLPDVAAIIQKVCEESQPGDLVVIMSNGGFGGICEKLPAALRSRSDRAR